MRKAASSWIWTLGVFLTAAALVAVTGITISRRVEYVTEKPSGNGVDDAFRQMARRVTDLERKWEKALATGTQQMLETNVRELDPPVVGVIQWSWLNPSFSDPARAHRRGDGRDVVLRPVLEKFARGEPGEWCFQTDDAIHSSGWVEQAGRPLAWLQGNGKTAAMLLVDPLPAAEIVKAKLAETSPDEALGTFSQSPAGLSVFMYTPPGGQDQILSHHQYPAARPDEVLRHVSRFGDWTLRRYYPVREMVVWNVPLLAGSFGLATALCGAGIAVVFWQRKAAHVTEQRVSFVNRVSHELRTPLTNLLLNTDLALDHLQGDTGKVGRRLILIREETARLSRIVDNVQTFARIERGKGEIHAIPCDVGKVLAGVRETFTPLFERKSILCEYDCQLSSEVLVDQDALSQILSNLLSNIEKYAGEPARARVEVSLNSGSLVVEVRDNGPGIRADASVRIFQPFERADSRVNEGASGTGLGLSISRDLARQMGGDLDLLANDWGRGSRFRLRIPAVERGVRK